MRAWSASSAAESVLAASAIRSAADTGSTPSERISSSVPPSTRETVGISLRGDQSIATLRAAFSNTASCRSRSRQLA